MEGLQKKILSGNYIPDEIAKRMKSTEMLDEANEAAKKMLERLHKVHTLNGVVSTTCPEKYEEYNMQNNYKNKLKLKA